ncbi:MAG: molybdopterin molybdotransferase MoeA [Gammaproteobacteria bacterium]|jgi:molybdopterin molybdotransferase|nr:molybdopterin molybdotransferase MoeA [Bacteroidales bacterium]MDG2434230.1 molybdopterin molybdotransferase MoeA [Gammaproteobacteria bacterium]
MINYKEALNIIEKNVTSLAVKDTDVKQAFGINAKTLVSKSPVPALSNSAMDGVAIQTKETIEITKDNPKRFEIKNTIYAGDKFIASDENDVSFEIMTGALMPKSFDAVIPIEQAKIITENNKRFLILDEEIKKDRNVRLAGEDFLPGDIILEKGSSINPYNLMAILMNGIDKVQIFQSPKIGIIATGSELDGNNESSIPNTNGPYIEACVKRLGLQCTNQLHAKDDPCEIKNKIKKCIDSGSDIIITSGGVSAGKADFVPSVLLDMGAEILFHKVWIRPGKPILMAKLPDGKILFGLPGNPVSVAVGFRFFVNNAIRLMQGQAKENYLVAVNQLEFKKSRKFCFFAKAKTTVNDQGKLEVIILEGQESFKLNPFREANSWAIIPEGLEAINKDQEIEIVPLNIGEAINL